eukprot:CAMPEP_0183727876 /NCGR_PEP_ID=MMETSP0737-20130205/26614_1 /TAXON_ID=385413 /ORGANISM="Thalassiosira miniscula, Strain CCMP1093" /LENGTH=602 /DNA_ID=CAMNT_0025959627 /DNA_START=77 /DNA_END=1882 /DNA_ORIENTATION=+
MSNHNQNQNALNVLMVNARNNNGGRKRPIESFFPCPAGCGAHVTQREINDHLDQCLRSSDANGADEAVTENNKQRSTQCDKPDHYDRTGHSHVFNQPHNTENQQHDSSAPHLFKMSLTNTPKRKKINPKNNAFSRMMQGSATVFSGNKTKTIYHRFHLADSEGKVTWTSDTDEDSTDDNVIKDGPAKKIENNHKDSTDANKSPPKVEAVHWKDTVKMKKLKRITIEQHHMIAKGGSSSMVDTSMGHNHEILELTISSSLPPSQEKPRLVQRHSRLSVSHLKSCLQKSMRRRAPLPAVRVAMELADRSWGDLIRRLPIIVLEDSTLHPDFGLLVWLMVAESKGYFPCMTLLVRVLQIIFEVASCPRHDILSETERYLDSNNHKLPPCLSLKTPTAELFPTHQPTTNACEVLIRSMLLRAQYGGMKCDVQMLHSFALVWLRRFQSMSISSSFDSSVLEMAPKTIYWCDFPRILHEKAREKSETLVTSNIVCHKGLSKLNPPDVCSAGIDFHCSSVVEHLLSQHGLYASLCGHLAQLKHTDGALDREWIAAQVKSLIWNHSSGINYRRKFGKEKRIQEDPASTAIWNDVLKSPFEEYTKKFVRGR